MAILAVAVAFETESHYTGETRETGRCLWRVFDINWSLSRDVEVLSRITNFPRFINFGDVFENGPHAGPHNYIGGSMAGDWSPDGTSSCAKCTFACSAYFYIEKRMFTAVFSFLF